MASLAIHAAEDHALAACIEAGFRELGLREIEGLPISQWLAKRRAVELESVLLAMGDKDPTAYEKVVFAIDEARRKSKSNQTGDQSGST